MGNDPVGAEHSRSKGVNLRQQCPILWCEHHAYGMNGSGLVCRDTRRPPSLTKHGGSAWWLKPIPKVGPQPEQCSLTEDSNKILRKAPVIGASNARTLCMGQTGKSMLTWNR
jgi:hypothetical protein